MKPINAKELGLEVGSQLRLKTGSGAPPQLAKVKLPKPKMNTLERAYAQLLDDGIKNGSVLWWKFEGITLKLGDDCRYTPDFAVVAHDGVFELHETKGWMRDDALVKIKTAAANFPFRLFVIKSHNKGAAWEITLVKP